LSNRGWIWNALAATARNGDTVQTGRETTGSRKAYEDLISSDEQARGAAQRADR